MNGSIPLSVAVAIGAASWSIFLGVIAVVVAYYKGQAAMLHRFERSLKSAIESALERSLEREHVAMTLTNEAIGALRREHDVRLKAIEERCWRQHSQPEGQ